MILVLEAFVGPNEIEFIGILLAQSGQDIDLDLPLTCVRRMILQDLDSHHFVRSFLPAFDDLDNSNNKKTNT